MRPGGTTVHTGEKIMTTSSCKSLWVGTTIIALLALFASDSSARRKRDYRDGGFYAGVQFLSSTLDVDNEPGSALFIDEDGGGIEFKFGYSFNPVFSLELSLAGANHDTSNPAIDAEFGTLRVFGHYRFRPRHPLRPYVKAGLGGYTVRLEEQSTTVEITGSGVAFGGGLDYFFSRHFSLGIDYVLNVIEYDKAELMVNTLSVSTEIEEDGVQSTLGLALAFYF
jgi:opacity protein-like surface antigen